MPDAATLMNAATVNGGEVPGRMLIRFFAKVVEASSDAASRITLVTIAPKIRRLKIFKR